MMSSVLKPESRLRESRYLMLAALPPVALIALCVYGFARQFSSASWIETEIRAIESSGEPYDNHSNTAMYNDHNSVTDRGLWDSLQAAASVLNVEYNAATQALKENGTLVSPEQPWPSKQVADRHSRNSQPIIRQIAGLVDRDKPLRIAGYFDGDDWGLFHNTGYQIWILITNEFYHAVRSGDASRAIEVLTLHERVFNKVFSAEHGPGALELIRDSLALDVWESEELGQLRSLVQGTVPNKWTWAEKVAVTRSNFLVDAAVPEQNIDYRSTFYQSITFELPNHYVQSYLALCDDVMELDEAGTRAHVLAVHECIHANREKRYKEVASDLAAIPLVATEPLYGHDGSEFRTMAIQFAIQRMHQRRTLTAIAIKQFQQQVGRWPKSLGELSQVGLAAADWMFMEGVPFGYQVASDNQSAVLWTSGDERKPNGANAWTAENYEMPSSPPHERILNSSIVEKLETKIR